MQKRRQIHNKFTMISKSTGILNGTVTMERNIKAGGDIFIQSVSNHHYSHSTLVTKRYMCYWLCTEKPSQ
jgi:hypothetical protein